LASEWLTRRGAAAALAVGLATVWGMGWRGLVLLLAFFISGSVLTPGGGRRNARQVIANGGAAALAALAGSWAAFAGALTAAAADTWATEIGARSRQPPRLITTWKPVATGTSGGITLLGTAGGIAGATLIAGIAALLTRSGAILGTVGVAGVLGMLLDSVLGATLQGVYECPQCAARTEQRGTVCHEPVRLVRGFAWLDNDAVNLAATLFGAAVAAAPK
jgi:uncharacterized protein (TIGR00297 family)